MDDLQIDHKLSILDRRTKVLELRLRLLRSANIETWEAVKAKALASIDKGAASANRMYYDHLADGAIRILEDKVLTSALEMYECEARVMNDYSSVVTNYEGFCKIWCQEKKDDRTKLPTFIQRGREKIIRAMKNLSKELSIKDPTVS